MPLDSPARSCERDLAIADLCRFAAACHYEPEAAFAEEGIFGAMETAAAVLDGELASNAARIGTAFSRCGLVELQIDYSRLFLGPPSPLAKPYASVWLAPDGQDATEAILQLYADAGLELDDGFAELPDHVAAELELLYMLARRAAIAAFSADAAGRDQAEALRRRLVRHHLGRWIGPFTEAVAASAHTGFYRELASFTARLLELEATRAA